MAELKNVLSPESLEFLEKYLNTSSPTGFEHKGQKVWLEYMKPYIDEYQVDNYGTVYGVINPGQDYKVVIEAHADEIAWFVNHVTSDGFIYVIRNGGSDPLIAPSKRVNIYTRDGKVVKGVFGWPAIHLRHGEESKITPKIDNIFIDIGCSSKEEVDALGIHVGCVITFEDEFMTLNDRYFVGRALDNRMGGYMIAQVARLLKENNIQLPYSLYVVNSVQEEVGLRGAQMITETIKPNVALVTDVGHDTTTPMISKIKFGEFKAGLGPQLAIAPAVHNKFLDLIFEAAKENNIPYQPEANFRSTGTDTDAFAYSNGGVVSALLTLTLRYMHTTVEMVHKEDVESVIKLMYYTLQKIENNHDFRYFS
ncbi:MAG: M42 family metallopeptidase [Chitinophagales bacterium]